MAWIIFYGQRDKCADLLQKVLKLCVHAVNTRTCWSVTKQTVSAKEKRNGSKEENVNKVPGYDRNVYSCPGGFIPDCHSHANGGTCHLADFCSGAHGLCAGVEAGGFVIPYLPAGWGSGGTCVFRNVRRNGHFAWQDGRFYLWVCIPGHALRSGSFPKA